MKIEFNNIDEMIRKKRLEKLIELAKGQDINLIFNTKGLSEEEIKANQQKIMAIKAIANNLEISEEQFLSEILRVKSMNPFFLK